MANIPSDPLEQGGIEGFGKRFRWGAITAEAATQAYLARIAALDPVLGAYEYVAADQALAAARAADGLLASGTDLGPLMGVAVAIKDLFAVDGMPVTAGSNLDVTDLIGPEGGFVKRLKQAGCVILGKLKTVEFALGGSGTNYNRGTPRNPWDAEIYRVAAGSSAGAGVAMAAGLTGFAIGSDTGGSVRGPAAYCGVVGVKTSAGLWPMDGIFPMSKTLDTIGPLTRSAADAAVIIGALTGADISPPTSLGGLRLGRPKNFFFDGVDEHVEKCIEAALADIAKAGAEIVEIDVPEIEENPTVFGAISRPELVAVFGRERFLGDRDKMNPDVADRAAPGLDVSADVYIRNLWRHRELREIGRRSMQTVDAWVGPVKSRVAPPFPPRFTTVEDARALVDLCAGPTRPANVFGFCATSQPVHQYGSALPVGLQVMCLDFHEPKLLSIARAIEDVIGEPSRPDLGAFLES